MRGLLDDVLGAMDNDIRTVFVLYEFEDQTTAEIGRLLSVPRGTVASRLRRARIVFRERVATLEAALNAEVES
jgi:RNA polymerase sigma-70 factor (ECF subfamily)